MGKFDGFGGQPPAVRGNGHDQIIKTSGDDAVARIRSQVRDPAVAARFAHGLSRFAIALDATGSMSGLLTSAKQAIGEILRRVQQEAGRSIEIELLVFRDYDMGNRVMERSGASTDAGRLECWLATVQPMGGGSNAGEAVEAALAPLAAESGWSAILLAGDEPSNGRRELIAHHRSETPTAHDLATKFGKRRVPVHAFVVGADPATIADFATISRLSGGVSGRLDGSAEMIDLAVMSILASIKGAASVRAYMDAHRLTYNAAKFGAQLLIGKS